MLDLTDVTRRFRGPRGPVVAVDGISGVLGAGVTLLCGPNGSGKSTLLRVLAGIVRPDTGTVRWHGAPITRNLASYRRRLGYLPQQSAAYPEMTVTALLDYIAALKAIPPHLAARRRDELLTALGLAHTAQVRLGRLPQGQRQLVGAAQALLGDPDVLLLDEPFEGLDHDSRHRLLAWLHRPGRVTVLATHRDELAIPGTVAVWHLRGGKLLAEIVNGGHPQLVKA